MKLCWPLDRARPKRENRLFRGVRRGRQERLAVDQTCHSVMMVRSVMTEAEWPVAAVSPVK